MIRDEIFVRIFIIREAIVWDFGVLFVRTFTVTVI